MIRIAKIINTRGLKGECKLMLYTDEPKQRFEKGAVLYVDEKESRPLRVERFSMYKGFGYAYFEEITTIEQAEALKNHTLYLPAETLPDPEEDEFYYHQLAGCRVLNQHGQNTGTVSDILETGANLVLRVKGEEGEYLLPFVGAIVQDVDVDQKIIHIQEIEGLR